jgi:hypothetical protein
MGSINFNTPEGQKLEAKHEFAEAKANAAIAEIDADVTTLNNGPTNAQVIQIVKRSLLRQKKIIQLLKRLI